MTEQYPQTPEANLLHVVSFGEVERRLTMLSTVVLRPEAAEIYLQEARGYDDVLDTARSLEADLSDLEQYKQDVERAIIERQQTIDAMSPQITVAQQGLAALFKQINGLATESQLAALAKAREQATKIPPQPSQPPQPPKLIREEDTPTVQRLQPALHDQVEQTVLQPAPKVTLTPLPIDDHYLAPLPIRKRR